MAPVGNASDTCGTLRAPLLILHWISWDAGARPFGKRGALTETAWIHIEQKESLLCAKDSSKSLTQVP